jgi:hypothetical protein
MERLHNTTPDSSKQPGGVPPGCRVWFGSESRPALPKGSRWLPGSENYFTWRCDCSPKEIHSGYASEEAAKAGAVGHW